MRRDDAPRGRPVSPLRHPAGAHRAYLWSPAAEARLAGTAVHESGLEAFDQWTGPGDATLGPAIGVYQIEPATLRDVLDNFAACRSALNLKLRDLAAKAPALELQLATNLAFATAIARLVYWATIQTPVPFMTSSHQSA